MNVKASIAAAVLGLVAGVGCSSGGDSPAVTPAGQNGAVSSTTAPPAAVKAFDVQAYCVEKLAPMIVKYPKAFADSDKDAGAGCRKMIAETDATSAKTIDALLETAEGYYKMVG